MLGWAVVGSILSSVRAETPREITLSNGVTMPTAAFGTWHYNDSYASSGVVLAVQAGFRSIDTANDYFNQVGTGEGIGAAISSGAVTRADLFVTSKVEGCGVPHPPHGTPVRLGNCHDDTLAVFKENLQLLKLPFVDLMLVHKPPPGGCSAANCPRMQEQWAAFETMLSDGKARAIGVSNYCVSCLECLAKTWKVVPVVNQIQMHVGMGPDPEGLVSYCRAKNIQIQAYSPLDVDQANGTDVLISGPLTNGIGVAHGNKSGATIALKWLAQQRIPLVTKAHSLKYLAEDIDLFGWELTEAEMAKLNAAKSPGGHPSMMCTSESTLNMVAGPQILWDKTEPRVAFAVQDLHDAVAVDSSENAGWAVTLTTASPKEGLHPESYSIICNPYSRDIQVKGGGTVGTMYGGLRLAELLRHDAVARNEAAAAGERFGGRTGPSLSRISNITVGTPLLELRGLKLNAPLDARTPSYGDMGDSAQHNIATMWDLTFWQEHLDHMAKHQYNLLSIWSDTPWPSLLDFSGIPEYKNLSLDNVYRADIDFVAKNRQNIQGNEVDPNILSHLKLVKTLSIAEKVQFWQAVMLHANQRGIKVMFVTWNIWIYPILNNETSPEGLNVSQTNLHTIDYVRKAVNLSFGTYPHLSAIGTDPGEHMENLQGEFSKEEWVWRTYGMGMQDALDANPDRKIWMMVRHNGASIPKILDAFKPLEGRIADFQVGYKYAHNAHMFGTTHPPYAYHDVLPVLTGTVKALWNLRNDDLFNFRFGSPKYAYDYYRQMPLNVTAGMHMGSDGYVWARTWADKKQVTQHGLEIEKHWYNFMTWGRCAYQPCDAEHSLGSDFWISELGARFSELSATPGAARVLYLGWINASEIIPQVNRLVIGKWVNDAQWNPEGCFNRDGLPEQGNGFVDVRKFGQYTPVEGVDLIALKDYVDAVVHDKPINGTTPVQVVSRLELMAAATQKAVHYLRSSVNDIGAELDATLADLSVFASLGRYYASKLCGSTELGLYNATKSPPHKEKAVTCLQEALTHWKEYTALATAQYTYPQLLARVAVLDLVEFTENVQADIKIAQEM